MFVDDYNNDNPNIKGKKRHSFSTRELLHRILKSVEKTPKQFFKALKKHPNKGDLNEDGLTQIFITQNHYQILNQDNPIPIHVSAQYVDTYRKSKGRPDIHYTFSEKGKSYEPTFVMEAKRLPPPEKHRKKEYVRGTTPSGNPNGGIERFKLGKHGIGLKECGLLGFIEADTPKTWLKKINGWIIDLSPKWTEDECLSLHKETKCFYQLTSNCHRQNDTIKLHHFWLHKIQ